MNPRNSFYLLLLVLSLFSCKTTKRVCFTFDDLPIAGDQRMDSAVYVQTFNKLTNKLKDNKIPAIGFVNEQSLFSKGIFIPYKLELLKYWRDSGLQLGNHTYSHKSYHKVSLKEYATDIEKGAEKTKQLMVHESGYYYFRPPYLHIGDSKEKADSLSTYLEQNSYKIAPVTIDNEDYLFAVAYDKSISLKDSLMTQKIKNAYLAYMEQKLVYFEMIAQKAFDRNINQILLLHNNQLNADCIESLIKIFKSHDYKFISLKKALDDVAYQTRIEVYKNWGISWLERWAISKKIPREYLKQDPSTPSFINEYIEN